MKIYTKTGDDGTTGLFGGQRVAKDHPRIAACGTLDELNAALGSAVCLPLDDTSLGILKKIQHDLFTIGAELATPPDQAHKLAARAQGVDTQDVLFLQNAIDGQDATLLPLKQFVLPGGSTQASTLHWARAVCRRAERQVIELHHSEPVREQTLIYLNRLSDLLFVLARFANHHLGIADVPWQPTSK